MGLSYATVDTSTMELTPMKVSFQGPGDLSLIELGGTLSNVIIETKYEKAEIRADQLGTTILDRRVKGLTTTVTTEITQVLDKAKWAIVFPHADYVTTGTASIKFNSAVGDSDLANAGLLKLHPLSKDASDVTADYTFFKACASAESTISFGPDKQATLKIVWNILPDTSVTPAKFYHYGDPSVV